MISRLPRWPLAPANRHGCCCQARWSGIFSGELGYHVRRTFLWPNIDGINEYPMRDVAEEIESQYSVNPIARNRYNENNLTCE
jgi:hypothetical protein